MGEGWAKKGLSTYIILQMMLDCAIRYMDDRHNLTAEMEKVMSIFEHMEGWRDALNLADPSAKKIIGEAIYFLFDEEGKRKGARAVHVTRPFFGNWTEDENIEHIMNRVFALLIPERYNRIQQLKADIGCASTIDFIDYIIDRFGKEADVAEIRRTFEDAARAENGRPLAYGQRSKKTRKPSMEQSGQNVIRFSDNEQMDESTY